MNRLATIMKYELTWKKKRGLFVFLVVAPILAYYIVFLIYPMIGSLVASFFKWNLAVGVEQRRFIGFGNYMSIFSKDQVARKAIKNTLLFVLYVVPAVTAISLFAGILFDKVIRGLRSVYTVCFFLPIITSLVAVSMIWKWLYHPVYGLINYFMGLTKLPYMTWLQNPKQALPAIAIMTIWRYIGYNGVIFLAGLQSIPSMFYEAAYIDGANTWKQFKNITLPLIVPTLLFSMVMSFIGTMTTFTQIFIMTRNPGSGSHTGGGPARSTTTIAYYIFETGIKWLEIGQASALAYVLFLIILLFTYLQFRLLRAEWRY
jgi:multiple sugar transport system permease protein